MTTETPAPLAQRLRSPSFWAIFLGLLYGVVLYLIASRRHGDGEGVLMVMNFGFVFLVPAGLGAMTVAVEMRPDERTWWRAVWKPWRLVLICLAASFVLGFEGTICILMAMPVFLVMSSVGGLIMMLILKTTSRRMSHLVLFLILGAPLASSAVEGQLSFHESVVTVDTQIRIRASPEVVWRHIARVAAIRPDEHRPSFFHRIGFPRPIEATLSHDGVGGVRHASFEGNLVFLETVNEWEPNKRLSFSIHADPSAIPTTTLDEHVTIGGPFFDVLRGTYWIEPIGPDGVVLHLSSAHRLSTHFNGYASTWTDAVMRDIQVYILEVIQRRCEGAR